MNTNFHLSFSGETLQQLEAALAQAVLLEELELETLTPEIVELLIQNNKPIHTLIIEEPFVDGTLLTQLLSAIEIGNLIFPGYDACECECNPEEECAEEEPPFEPEENEEIKFKNLDLTAEETLQETLETLANPALRTAKFKGCNLPTHFIDTLVQEFAAGSLSHLTTLSISKDPEALNHLTSNPLPSNLTLTLKKKDGLTLERNL